MLYVIQRGYSGVERRNPEEIVYCISSVAQILDSNISFYFTDGHAVNKLSEFYTSEELERIDEIIDKKAIDGQYWKTENDQDLKRRKEAEFLIESDLPVSAIRWFAVYNKAAKEKLLALSVKEKQIVIRSQFYF